MEFKTKNILLNKTKISAFYLVASDKEEIEEFAKAFYDKETKPPFIKQVEVFGESKDATSSIAKAYISVESINHKKEALENGSRNYKYWVEKEYPCFCRGKKIIENNLIIHEDPLSSLKCALYRIGSPEYCYIIKIKLKDNLKDYDTNSSGNTSVCEESEDVKQSES
jgi:hypothetical protein